MFMAASIAANAGTGGHVPLWYVDPLFWLLAADCAVGFGFTFVLVMSLLRSRR